MAQSDFQDFYDDIFQPDTEYSSDEEELEPDIFDVGDVEQGSTISHGERDDDARIDGAAASDSTENIHDNEPGEPDVFTEDISDSYAEDNGDSYEESIEPESFTDMDGGFGVDDLENYFGESDVMDDITEPDIYDGEEPTDFEADDIPEPESFETQMDADVESIADDIDALDGTEAPDELEFEDMSPDMETSLDIDPEDSFDLSPDSLSDDADYESENSPDSIPDDGWDDGLDGGDYEGFGIN